MVVPETPLISIVCDSEGLLWIKFNLVSGPNISFAYVALSFLKGKKRITLEGLVVLQPMHCSGTSCETLTCFGAWLPAGLPLERFTREAEKLC